MELRIVQVGSQFIITGFENGRYVLDATGEHQPVANRNPRLLMPHLPASDIYSTPEEAEDAYRLRSGTEPVWDLYDAVPIDNTAISLNEASRQLGVDPGTLRNQIHNRSLSGYKIGRNWVISASELDRYRRENLGAVGRRPQE